MPSKEIKVEVVELMKIIVKQLENLMRQREEDQVFLAGLEQRLTALEQRLPAQPLAPVSADATATHDATSMSLTNSTSGLWCPVLQRGNCRCCWNSGRWADWPPPPVCTPTLQLKSQAKSLSNSAPHLPAVGAANPLDKRAAA